MPNRTEDVVLADGFTMVQHGHPFGALDPETNMLPASLNVLVIGASQGIGEGIACAYARAGAANLFLASRSQSMQRLQQVAEEAKRLKANIEVTCLNVDITSSLSVAQLVQQILCRVHRLDIVVLNSGYSGPVVLKVDEGNPKDFQDVFNVNVQGTYLVAHYFIPILKQSRGAKTFLVVNSFAACIIRGHIANTAYCISKLAQARLVEFISEQYAADGILAVAVQPGAVLTEMADKTTPESFRSCLTDDVGLCGAFCVWLSGKRRMWLNGRLLSATWDIDEIVQKRELVEEEDLLKFGYRTGSVSAVGSQITHGQ